MRPSTADSGFVDESVPRSRAWGWDCSNNRTAARRFGEPLGVDTVTNIGERFAEQIYFRVTPLTSVGWPVVRSTSIVNRGTFVLPVETSFRSEFFGSETIVGVFVG